MTQLSVLNTIQILCIKISMLDDIPRWRILKRRKIKKVIEDTYNRFLAFDVYEKVSALSSILIQYYVRSPEMIPEDLKDFVDISPISIKFYINRWAMDVDDGYDYTGTVTYITKSMEFDVDVFSKQDDGQFKFTYSNHNTPNSTVRRIFDDISAILDINYLDIIMCLADIINQPSLRINGVTEFVND